MDCGRSRGDAAAFDVDSPRGDERTFGRDRRAQVLQAHLRLVLRIRPAACDKNVSLYVELKSNIYGDILLRSPTRTIAVRRGGSGANATSLPEYPKTEALVWPYDLTCP